MDWKSYTILYEDYDSLIRLQEVFKAHEGLSHLEGYPPFTVRQLPSEDDDYRYVRVHTIASNSAQLLCIILSSH